jgi:LysR family hydrogen peroxide-inducible transcriptional activator
MNTRDLKYLVALATHRHFGKAAETCFVSQPGLSMQIKKLEETLGVQLIERTNKSVMLTDIGKQIAEKARQILQEVDELQEMANEAKDPESGELLIGIIPTLAPYLLPEIMPALTKSFPKLTIFLIEEQTAKLIEKLKNGSIHAAILALPLMEPHLIAIPLFEESFYLATPASHPFAKHKIIKSADLKNHELLLLEEGHCMREQTLTFCHHMHASESARFKATSLETLRHMVMAGIGLTLMPELACHQEKRISYIPFSKPAPSRSIGLCFRESTAKQPILRHIADKIKHTMRK